MSVIIGQPNQTGFSQILGEVGGGIGQGLQSTLQDFHQKKKINSLEEEFVSRGFPRDLARLGAIATQGGQTKLLEEVIRERRRRPSGALAEKLGIAEEGDGQVGVGEEEIGLTPEETVRRQEKEAQRSFERNKPYLNRISEMATELPKEKVALTQMRGAIEEGDFNSLRNALAEMTGFEVLKTASAQTVNSASKQFLMSSLAGLRGRPNQFIEQQITKALVSPLYRDVANQLILEGYEGLADLKEKEIEIALDLENKYTSQGKEIPRSFQKMVRDKLKEETERFEKKYEDRIRTLLSAKDNLVLMVDRQGNTREVPKEQRDAALKAGYKLKK